MALSSITLAETHLWFNISKRNWHSLQLSLGLQCDQQSLDWLFNLSLEPWQQIHSMQHWRGRFELERILHLDYIGTCLYSYCSGSSAGLMIRTMTAGKVKENKPPFRTSDFSNAAGSIEHFLNCYIFSVHCAASKFQNFPVVQWAPPQKRSRAFQAFLDASCPLWF